MGQYSRCMRKGNSDSARAGNRRETEHVSLYSSGSLLETEAKFVEHFVSEVFLKFEGIGTEEGQVTLIQDIAC